MLPAAYGFFSFVTPFHAKVRDTLKGQRNARTRWLSAADRLDGRPIWFHVSSVGEFEQARPVISALAKGYPDIPVVVSFTSPSGLGFATTKEVNNETSNIKFMDYLPIDFIPNAIACLEAIDPRLLVFVKFDLWPNLIWQAASRNVPTVLIDATLSGSSQRLTSIGKRFYRSIYHDIDKILAISETDADRFRACAPQHTGISVTGDTRFDRVMERRKNSAQVDVSLKKNGRFVILAGSTWPKDEAHLLKALARLAKSHKNLLFVIAPHEPTPDRVRELVDWARANQLHVTSYSGQNGAKDTDVLVLDTVGILAEAYEVADAAYVGGSFSTGVHNVIEPAIMGIPVLFGPNHDNSFEAIELVKCEAAVEVRDFGEIYDALHAIVTDAARRRTMGDRAQTFVESHLGATHRCMKILKNYL